MRFMPWYNIRIECCAISEAPNPMIILLFLLQIIYNTCLIKTESCFGCVCLNKLILWGLELLCFNVTFNNISVISWQSVLLVENWFVRTVVHIICYLLHYIILLIPIFSLTLTLFFYSYHALVYFSMLSKNDKLIWTEGFNVWPRQPLN